MPYETAFALTHSPESDDLLTALAAFDALGAQPMADHVRAVLRARGVARVPRGPQPTTRENPAGLTGRQLDVVTLMAQGMTNAEIADHLVLSVRTVDSHVAAAFDKLGARTRKDAVAKARALGIT